MKLTVYKCDWCGKTVENFYDVKGWVHVEDDALTIADGTRDCKLERYTTKICCSDKNQSLDFCSIDCFLKWLFLSKETRGYKLVTEEEEKEFYFDCVHNL